MTNLLSTILSRLKQPRQRIKVVFNRAFSKTPIHSPMASEPEPPSTSAELTIRFSEDADTWSGHTASLLNMHDVYVNTESTLSSAFDGPSTNTRLNTTYFANKGRTPFPKGLMFNTSGSAQPKVPYTNATRVYYPERNTPFGTINTSHAVASQRSLLFNAQCRSVRAISSQTNLVGQAKRAITPQASVVFNSNGAASSLAGLGVNAGCTLGLKRDGFGNQSRGLLHTSCSTEVNSANDDDSQIPSAEKRSQFDVATTPSSKSPTSRRNITYSTPLEEALSPNQVHEIITLIGKFFSHIPHAICGPSALAYHGNTLHSPKFITMLVALSSVETLKRRAVSLGLPLSPYNTEDIGIRTSDGTLRCVRIIPIAQEELAKRGIVEQRECCGGKVLSLPFVADDLAKTFMLNVEKGSRFGEAVCLRDLGWVLGRIRDEGGLRLEGRRLEGLWDGEFVKCCLGRWPGLRGLLDATGVGCE